MVGGSVDFEVRRARRRLHEPACVVELLKMLTHLSLMNTMYSGYTGARTRPAMVSQIRPIATLFVSDMHMCAC